jgi:uncharacterized protein with HEPN domain
MRQRAAHRDQGAVEDILDFCEQAARLVARGREAFENDEMLPLAGEALAQRVGEAASRLSQAFRSASRCAVACDPRDAKPRCP